MFLTYHRITEGGLLRAYHFRATHLYENEALLTPQNFSVISKCVNLIARVDFVSSSLLQTHVRTKARNRIISTAKGKFYI